MDGISKKEAELWHKKLPEIGICPKKKGFSVFYLYVDGWCIGHVEFLSFFSGIRIK